MTEKWVGLVGGEGRRGAGRGEGRKTEKITTTATARIAWWVAWYILRLTKSGKLGKHYVVYRSVFVLSTFCSGNVPFNLFHLLSVHGSGYAFMVCLVFWTNCSSLWGPQGSPWYPFCHTLRLLKSEFAAFQKNPLRIASATSGTVCKAVQLCPRELVRLRAELGRLRAGGTFSTESRQPSIWGRSPGQLRPLLGDEMILNSSSSSTFSSPLRMSVEEASVGEQQGDAVAR